MKIDELENNQEVEETVGISDFVFIEDEVGNVDTEDIEEDETEEEEDAISEEDIEEEYEEEIEVDDNAKALYETMVEKNILRSDDEFDNSWETLEKKIDELPQSIAKQIITEAPDVTQKLIKYAFALGDNANIDELSGFFNLMKNEKETVDSSILDDEEKSRELLKKEYLNSGQYDEDEIEDILDVLEDKNKIKSKVKKILDSRREESKNISDKKLQEVESKNEAVKAKRQEHYNSIINEIDSLGWKSNVKEELKRIIRPEVSGPITQKIQQSPKALVQLLNIYRLFDEEKGEFDFSSLEKKGESRSSNNIRKNIFKDKFSNSKSTKSSRKAKQNRILKEDIDLIME